VSAACVGAENAKQEVEQQQAELPSLEIVSAEIKALKRAVLLLRRRNSELLAWEGQKRLREMLPPISDIEATYVSTFRSSNSFFLTHPTVTVVTVWCLFGNNFNRTTTVKKTHERRAPPF